MKHLINFLKGIFVGIANVIPGVSGGTIAVITGIYDRLMGAVSGFFRGGEGSPKANIVFLLPIGAGMLTGLFGFSNVIVWARAFAPVQTSLLFAGLILGSLPFLWLLARKDGFKISYLIPFLATLCLVAGLSLMNEAPETEAIRSLNLSTGLWFFFTAIIGMAAMVVPGLSGSFVLLLLGTYNSFVSSIKEFNIPLLLIFGFGALIGVLGIARLLDILLKRFHGYTYFGILGLVLGSLVDLGKRALEADMLQVSSQNLGAWSLPLALFFLLLGAFAAYFLSGRKKLDHQTKPEV